MAGVCLTGIGVIVCLCAVPRWLLQLSRFFLIGILVVSMGGHYALLQTIAWGSMLFTFSDSGSLSEAVDKTFDGEHPCELCKLVKETKREEDRKPVSMVVKKQDVVLSVQIKAPVPRGTDLVVECTPYERWVPEGCDDVLLRPPRLV